MWDRAVKDEVSIGGALFARPVYGGFPWGFRLRDNTKEYEDGSIVYEMEVPALLAFLREHYPQHFPAQPKAKANVLTVDVEARGLDAVARDAKEAADHLERAAAALERIKGGR